MSFPASHKTVFILDGSSYFKRTSSQQPIVFDVPIKRQQEGGQSAPQALPPICKSLWTCSVESVMEFCRIIWDLYVHGERVIQCVVTGEDPDQPNAIPTLASMALFNSWSVSQFQNCNALSDAFARCLATHAIHEQERIGVIKNHGATSETFPTSLIHGISQAIELLTQSTEIQSEKKLNGQSIQNRGRIIVVSSFSSEKLIRQLETILDKSISEFNRLLTENKNPQVSTLLPVRHCEAIIINTYPCDATPVSCPASGILEYPKREISHLLSTKVISTKSGRYLSARMTQILLSDYDLASSTITGIPMKEEQNASSSSNYDVEIMHPRSAHDDLMKVVGSDQYVNKCKREEETPYDTILLKWCTPKPGAPELHPCSNAVRVTPVDVNSRPSTCLTNFLLAGRSVMLELPRTKGQKVTSHMLSSHYGELYIHSLAVSRSILEDPPSISEGVGGRVTDYRINDFKELIKQNVLSLCEKSPLEELSQTADQTPLKKSIDRLKRATLYWPIEIGQTIIFNTQSAIEKLITLIPQENLSQEDVQECKSAIFAITHMETKGIHLPIPSVIATRGKGPKRDDLYRMLWNEVEYFINLYSNTPEHNIVLNCVQECRSKNSPSLDATKTVEVLPIVANPSLIVAGKRSMPEVKASPVTASLDLKSAKKFCPEFPEPGNGPVKTGMNLLTYMQNKIDTETERKRKQFQGRVNKEYRLYEAMLEAQAKET